MGSNEFDYWLFDEQESHLKLNIPWKSCITCLLVHRLIANHYNIAVYLS